MLSGRAGIRSNSLIISVYLVSLPKSLVPLGYVYAGCLEYRDNHGGSVVAHVYLHDGIVM